MLSNEKILSLLEMALRLDKGALDSVSETADLREIGLDSITSIELIVLLENEFDISVDDEDLLIDNFNNIAKIKSLVQKYINGGQI